MSYRSSIAQCQRSVDLCFSCLETATVHHHHHPLQFPITCNLHIWLIQGEKSPQHNHIGFLHHHPKKIKRQANSALHLTFLFFRLAMGNIIVYTASCLMVNQSTDPSGLMQRSPTSSHYPEFQEDISSLTWR